MLRLSLLVEPISANMPLSNREGGVKRRYSFKTTMHKRTSSRFPSHRPENSRVGRGCSQQNLGENFKLSKKKQVALQFLEPNIAEY